MIMEEGIKNSLLCALEGENKEKVSMDESVRDFLVSSLDEGKVVLDSSADYRNKSSKRSLARKALIEKEKEKARRKDLLNPQPTSELDKQLELAKELREVGWDIGDAPDSKEVSDGMLRDINNLRKEAGIKVLNDNYKPYAEYRKAWDEYRNGKKFAYALYKKTAALFKSKEYKTVRNNIETMRKMPKWIEGKYEEILTAFDNCCRSLCEDIEKNGKDKGLKDQSAFEEEKHGVGMMKGETAKEYQKRMRSIGLGKEIPITIENIDTIVEHTERRWSSVAGIGMDEFAIVKDNFAKTIEKILAGCSFATNLPIAGVCDVLEDHLPSQYEIKRKSKEPTNILAFRNDFKKEFERKCFGVEGKTKDIKFEKFGCLHTLSPSNSDGKICTQYGRNVIRWKKSKTIATMIFGDSVSLAYDGVNYINPCLVSNPSPCCFNPTNESVIRILKKRPLVIGIESLCRKFGSMYCELQLHGEYTAESIDSISFGSMADIMNLTKPAIDKILELEIPLYVDGKTVNIDESGRIKRAEEAESS